MAPISRGGGGKGRGKGSRSWGRGGKNIPPQRNVHDGDHAVPSSATGAEDSNRGSRRRTCNFIEQPVGDNANESFLNLEQQHADVAERRRQLDEQIAQERARLEALEAERKVVRLSKLFLIFLAFFHLNIRVLQH